MSDDGLSLLPRWWLPVFCTDRGQHQETDLGALTVVARINGPPAVECHQPETWSRELRPAAFPKRRSVWLDTGGRLNLACPRCRRHVEWSAENAVEHVTGMHAAGLDRFDLSHVP